MTLDFANFATWSAVAVAALAFAPAYAAVRWTRLELASARATILFLAASLLVFNFEYYVLGPYSFVDLSTEGNLTVAVNHYLAHHDGGGRFVEPFAGGQDGYMFLPGLQYFNPERLAAGVLPTWGALLFHKMYFIFLTFLGVYLLARRYYPESPLASVAIALIVPLSHPYFLNFSTNWGTGFAALPIAVYAAFCDGQVRRFAIWVAVATLMVGSADPVHFFPVFIVAMAGVACFERRIHGSRVAVAVALYVVASFLNWHEFLYANVALLEYTTRDFFGAASGGNFTRAIIRSLWDVVYRVPVPLVVSVIGLAILAIRADRYWVRSGLALLIVVVAFVLAETMPWGAVGLPVVAKLSHHYMLLALSVVMIPITARMIASLDVALAADADAVAVARGRPAHVLLATAVALLIYNKAVNLQQFLWFGGQSAFFGYKGVEKADWRPAEPFRVVTMFERPPSNIVAAMYGLDSFDGQLNTYVQALADYWSAVVWRHPRHELTGRTGLYWQYWDGRQYRVEDHLRLDLLEIANVRFLLSALPLESDRLTLVRQPAAGERAMRRPSEFSSLVAFAAYRVRRIFDPGRLYVYELARPSPRVFAATGVEFLPEAMDRKGRLDHIAEAAPRRIAVIPEVYREAVGRLAVLNVNKVERIVDGYTVDVTAPDGGLLIVNQVYLPFWQARTGTRRLTVIPANAIHFAVPVPPGAKRIDIEYRRPLLREKIAALAD